MALEKRVDGEVGEVLGEAVNAWMETLRVNKRL